MDTTEMNSVEILLHEATNAIPSTLPGGVTIASLVSSILSLPVCLDLCQGRGSSSQDRTRQLALVAGNSLRCRSVR
jgi:hypothetical protein